MTQKTNEKIQINENEDSINKDKTQEDQAHKAKTSQENLFNQNTYQETSQENSSDDQATDIRSRLFQKPIKRKMSIEEAMMMLAVNSTDPNEVSAQFKKLMSLNDPAQGGSFYLQCKLMGARETLHSSIKKDPKLL